MQIIGARPLCTCIPELDLNSQLFYSQIFPLSMTVSIHDSFLLSVSKLCEESDLKRTIKVCYLASMYPKTMQITRLIDIADSVRYLHFARIVDTGAYYFRFNQIKSFT